MSSDIQVFVLSTEGRFTGTPDSGSIIVNRDTLPADSFMLRLTSFNTIFSSPNVSPSRGNIIQVDDGTVIQTIVLPTGSYGIEGSNDIGQALVTLMNAALPTGDFKSSYNDITNHYTFTSSAPFRFLWSAGNVGVADQIGFSRQVRPLATSQTGDRVPKFYDNTILVTIEADNSTTQLVKMPRGSSGSIACSFIIPRTVDYGEQIYLTMNQIAPQRLLFSTPPASLTWRITRPNGLPMEQEFDWTAVFAIELAPNL